VSEEDEFQPLPPWDESPQEVFVVPLESDLVAAFNALAARPQCEHNLNGRCAVCGPSLNLEEAIAWQRELGALGITAPPAD
jgi:hypothetical protein